VGVAYGEVISSTGEFTTDPVSAHTSGRMVLRYAGETREVPDEHGGTREEYDMALGRGFALDVGAAAELASGWTVSAVLKDLSPGISWPEGTERGFVLHADSMTVEEGSDNEDLVTSEDTWRSTGRFTTPYPPALRVGVMRQSGRLLVAADYEQGLASFAGRTTTPRLSGGVEYGVLGFLPLRAGVSLGGGLGPSLAGGMGLDLGPFTLDVAARNRGITSGGSKGLSLAVTSALRF
jgi:hypothetical protein